MSTLRDNDAAVRQIRQIAGDDEQLVDELLQNSILVRLKKGQFAFRAGEQCSAYLVVLRGHVRVQLISAGGREVTLYRVDPGSTCVLTTSCLLSGDEYPAEAIAESDVDALGISQGTFQSALANHSGFRSHVFERFSERLKNVIVRVEDLVFESVDARLARALLRLESEGRQEVTHQELAVELGTAREVVSRHLKQFQRDGLVNQGRGKVAVTNQEQLKRIGSPARM